MTLSYAREHILRSQTMRLPAENDIKSGAAQLYQSVCTFLWSVHTFACASRAFRHLQEGQLHFSSGNFVLRGRQRFFEAICT